VALLGAPAEVRAEPVPSGAEALLRSGLGQHLEPAEVERLLRDARVERALGELFEGWDGVADEVRVDKDDGVIVVHTFIRERRCLARLELGRAEAGGPLLEPHCDEPVRVDGERELALDATLWRRPAPRVADVRPAPRPELPPEEPHGPVEHTVLRVVPRHGLDLGPVALARVDHERLKEALARPHWKDPLLPADAVLAGEALRPIEAPLPALEARVEANLRNPFDEARMRPALPMPDGMDLARDGGSMPLLPALREECAEQWRRGLDNPEPPTLDCYRRVAWNGRL
jgi:hypothetical protein